MDWETSPQSLPPLIQSQSPPPSWCRPHTHPVPRNGWGPSLGEETGGVVWDSRGGGRGPPRTDDCRGKGFGG